MILYQVRLQEDQYNTIIVMLLSLKINLGNDINNFLEIKIDSFTLLFKYNTKYFMT